MLILGLAAANMDPAVRPDLSVPVHGNRSHLAFSGGPHECPGQDIGRAIADVGVDLLLMRLPDLRLDCAEEELRWTESIASQHLVELPVRFTPRPQQDVKSPPSHTPMPVPQARAAWEISTVRTGPAASLEPEPAVDPDRAATGPRRPAPPRPRTPLPTASPMPPAAEPAQPQPRSRSVRQRLLRWWRGY
jgi:hypothetical protein